jgi:hypothetical protein
MLTADRIAMFFSSFLDTETRCAFFIQHNVATGSIFHITSHSQQLSSLPFLNDTTFVFFPLSERFSFCSASETLSILFG